MGSIVNIQVFINLFKNGFLFISRYWTIIWSKNHFWYLMVDSAVWALTYLDRFPLEIKHFHICMNSEIVVKIYLPQSFNENVLKVDLKTDVFIPLQNDVSLGRKTSKLSSFLELLKNKKKYSKFFHKLELFSRPTCFRPKFALNFYYSV